MKLQLPKGTRDLAPYKLIIRNKIVDTLKKIFENYGYSPLDTPLFERYEVLASKYAGGAEILKETFRFMDQGKRELALRYDLTVPMCRFVGMNPNLKLPFKRYQIGEVFRDGPVESARYRQFTQCDVDIVGCKTMNAEAEIISMASRFFSSLGFDFVIRVNNRKLLNDILSSCKVPKDKLIDTILSIDKLEKIGFDGVSKELVSKGLKKEVIDNIEKIITIKGTNDEKLSKLKKILKYSDGIKEIEELINLVGKKIVFDVSLARGLSYYTGTVMEVFLRRSKVKSAVCAGGRYDKMIGDFLGKGDYPAMGISFGLDRIYDAYVEKNKVEKKTVTQVYVIPIGTFQESLKITEKLRDEGINAEIDLRNNSPSKNLKYANSLGIPTVVIIGEDELKSGKVKIKDMQSGEEKSVEIKKIKENLK